MVWHRGKLALAFCSLVAVCTTSAMAQIAPVNVGPEPETGIHLGGFMLYPTLDVGGQYNDNVFAVDTSAQSDFSYEIHPALDLESTWTRYLVALKADYDLRQYSKFTSENTSNYLFSARTEFNLGSNSLVDASSEYARLTELRGNTNFTAGAAKPTNYNRWNNLFDFKHVFNRLQADLGGSYTTLRFENTPAVGGGTILEVDRDRDVASGYVDLGYQFSPGYEIFTRGTWNQRDYRLAISQFRNSSGYEAVGGVRAQLTHLIDGQAYVGYLSQDYKGFTKTVGGFDYGLQLNWSLTRLSTITAAVSRSIEETDATGASSYFATDASLGVTHALTRTVTLNAAFSYNNNKYQDIARNENIYGATAGIDYGLTPHFHLVADYRYSTRSSNTVGAKYNQNLIEAKVRLAL